MRRNMAYLVYCLGIFEPRRETAIEGTDVRKKVNFSLDVRSEEMASVASRHPDYASAGSRREEEIRWPSFQRPVLRVVRMISPSSPSFPAIAPDPPEWMPYWGVDHPRSPSRRRSRACTGRRPPRSCPVHRKAGMFSRAMDTTCLLPELILKLPNQKSPHSHLSLS